MARLTTSRFAETSRSLAVFSICSHCSGVTRMVLVNVSAIVLGAFFCSDSVALRYDSFAEIRSDRLIDEPAPV